MRYERTNRYDSGHWKSVSDARREREQQARDRRADANSQYLADEANN